mmetsp:Transcript_16461/g.27945  ORF Transcript_16461/g.27945 Transcript_16461/m.27945 type:complete len:88 (+) Transcript_16461:853-1116(+)
MPDKFCKELNHRDKSNLGTLMREGSHTFKSADMEKIPKDRLEIFLYQGVHMPSGTSLKNCIHMGQIIKSGVFQKFDFGVTGNYQVYG